MNVLFFLTPKNNVEYLHDTFSVRQALEKMEHHRYSSIPVIDKDGRYVETLSTSDLLWFIKGKNLNIEMCEKISIKEIQPHRSNTSIRIDKDVNDLIDLIVNQNFVPVEDDKGIFIGIITRKSVMDYLIKEINNKN